MKLHEVLDKLNCSRDMWFRPVSWAGCKRAYAITDGVAYSVPGFSGGAPHMTCYVDDLRSDWEIVSPDDVLNGN